jgi:hypothetical protein
VTRRRGGRRALYAALVAASCGAVLLVASGGCGGGGAPPVEKIVVLGIDGVDWHLADPLIAAGKLPNIAALVERGTRADLRTLEPPILSPIIWTTIATGKGPQKHGITSFLNDGKDQPLFNSNGWRARPVWDILGAKGHTVGVINWLVSWPAQPVNGYDVTDHIVYRPEDGFTGLERVTYPDEVADEIAPYACPVSSVTDDDLAGFFNGTAWRDTTQSPLRDGVETLRSIYAGDQTVAGVAKHLLETREQPDFFAVYLNGIDSTCHFFWGPMDPSSIDIPLGDDVIAGLKDIIPRYYERMDALVGEIVSDLDENSTIILCSDHGFRGPVRTSNGLKLGSWMHGPVGVLVAAGPGIAHGALVPDASVLDMTPTFLALLGEPVGRDMDGFVLTDLIDPGALKARPVTYVDTYETTPSKKEVEAQKSAVDEEAKARLRALGYIE